MAASDHLSPGQFEDRPLWHVTSRKSFRPSSDERPVTANGRDIADGPVLHATTSPFYWHHVSGGGSVPYTRGRKWAAELDVSDHPPVPRENPLQPESRLDPAKVKVKRIIPVDAAIAEETGYDAGGNSLPRGWRYQG